jgi:dephospho-CoA kinase
VIGLIGGIGAGKSRVAALLAAEHGAFVVDADAVGHALLEQRPVRDLVVSRFGPGILDQSREEEGPAAPRIDRRALGAVVFSDPKALAQLEAILHPRMRRTFARVIARETRRGRARAVVIDAAILLEAGWDTLCDRVVFVDAPRDLRLSRLAASRGWTAEALDAREAAQWPLDRKRARADAVVVNDTDSDSDDAPETGPGSLREAVRRLVDAMIPPASSPPARGRVPGAERAGPRAPSGGGGSGAPRARSSDAPRSP